MGTAKKEEWDQTNMENQYQKALDSILRGRTSGEVIEGRKLCEKLAKQGYAKAQLQHSKNRDLTKEESFNWCKKAAEQGYAAAQWELGNHYFNADGTRADHEKAIYWYEKSAEQGNTMGQSYCAKYYEGTRGIYIIGESNLPKALYWYKILAEKGLPAYQKKCRCMYFLGAGTAEELSDSIKYCEEAAKQGDGYEAFVLGMVYGCGLENNVKKVPRNKETAFYYFQIAAASGNGIADKIVKRMKRRRLFKTEMIDLQAAFLAAMNDYNCNDLEMIQRDFDPLMDNILLLPTIMREITLNTRHPERPTAIY